MRVLDYITIGPLVPTIGCRRVVPLSAENARDIMIRNAALEESAIIAESFDRSDAAIAIRNAKVLLR
jgi:hypothetical protein